MPINKAGKAYYTKEQYKMAKHECRALDYALRKGYHLIKEGKYYKMSGHDSMIFAPNGMWYWNSRGLRGKALDFIVAYEGRSVVDAVLELTEGTPLRDSPLKEYPPSMAEQISFILPPAAKNCRRLFAYLCGKRKLDRSVVSELIQRKLLYEGVSTAKSREYHNAVFVYYDPDGKAVGAYKRGLHSDVPYKGEVSGSNKTYGWLLRGNRAMPEEVYVFEAAIDAASQLSLARLHGNPAAEEIDRLSLEGLVLAPLTNYLSRYPTVRRVTLMLDNDKAGRLAAERFRERLKNIVTVEFALPPHGKDWNDTLVAETIKSKGGL